MLHVVIFQFKFDEVRDPVRRATLLSRLASAAIRTSANFKQRVNDLCQQQLWTWGGLTLVSSPRSCSAVILHNRS